MPMTRNGNWIQTYRGHRFWPCDPQTGDLDIGDIAHALSLVCRFTGHVREFYSVAQHSLLASQIVPQEDALWGLMHDASEAYIADVSRPVKPNLANYYEIEERLMRCVADRYGLPWPMPESVHHADDVLVITERRDLLGYGVDWGTWSHSVVPLGDKIVPMSPRDAEDAFLARFDELSCRRDIPAASAT